MSDHCESCGKPWAEHLGVQGTCERARRLQEALKPLLFAARKWMWDDDDRCVGCRTERGKPHAEMCYANHVVEQARKAMEGE